VFYDNEIEMKNLIVPGFLLEIICGVFYDRINAGLLGNFVNRLDRNCKVDGIFEMSEFESRYKIPVASRCATFFFKEYLETVPGSNPDKILRTFFKHL
jgi:hypothetical protein